MYYFFHNSFHASKHEQNLSKLLGLIIRILFENYWHYYSRIPVILL